LTVSFTTEMCFVGSLIRTTLFLLNCIFILYKIDL